MFGSGGLRMSVASPTPNNALILRGGPPWLPRPHGLVSFSPRGASVSARQPYEAPGNGEATGPGAREGWGGRRGWLNGDYGTIFFRGGEVTGCETGLTRCWAALGGSKMKR